MIASKKPLLDRWHQIVISRDFLLLADMLSETVEFHSPFIWEPYPGRELVTRILMTVSEAFQDFTYHREILDGNRWALEFSARIGDQPVKGIDLIEFDDQGQIVGFEVFVRPMAGLRALGHGMTRRLGGGA